jgi:thymidylate synthase (FAD)
MHVELLDHMGCDLDVVNAARVSFDNESECEFDWNWAPILSEKDERLIHYLAKHKHWTPFAHTSIKFRVTMPIYVARQLAKHQIGGVVNEVSRRYVSTAPVLDVPTKWRRVAENVKQGSSDELVEVDQEHINQLMDHCLATYDYLIESGVCPEQARVVIPICSETTWIWTGSLVFFARVCKLRLDSHAQKETRDVAEQISALIEPLFPISWAALMA